MDGWFPRFSRRGDLASGSGTVWVNGNEFAVPGWNPCWLDDDTVFFKGPGDMLFRKPLAGGDAHQVGGPAHQFSAGAGQWAAAGAQKYGGLVIRVSVDPSNGDLAELVEYGGQNENRSVFLRGQPVVEHQPVSDPCVRDGLLVWSIWPRPGDRETWGYDGTVRPLRVVQGAWEGAPIPVLASGPWVLIQTNTDLRLHPWGSTEGYIFVTGENRNLNADIRYDGERFQIVCNDEGGEHRHEVVSYRRSSRGRFRRGERRAARRRDPGRQQDDALRVIRPEKKQHIPR